MDDQNNLGAKDNAIKMQIPEARPIAISTSPPTTTILIPLIKRRWFKVAAYFAIIAAFVAFLGALFEIPNSIMNWFINAKTLFYKEHFASKTDTAAFSITFSWITDPGYWIVQDSRAYHVQYAVLATLTNLKPVPIMIDSYAVEEKMPDGKLRQVNFQFSPDSGAKIFHSGWQLTNAEEMNIVTFDSVIMNKIIAPNEPVRGWLFFTRDTDFQNVRFDIRDTMGTISKEPFGTIMTQFSTNLDFITTGVQPMLMKSTKNYEDISKFAR